MLTVETRMSARAQEHLNLSKVARHANGGFGTPFIINHAAQALGGSESEVPNAVVGSKGRFAIYGGKHALRIPSFI